MRTLLIGLVALAACGGDDGGGVAVDARPPIDAPFDGHWNLTWTRLGGGDARDIAQTTTLVVDDRTLTFGGGPGGQVHEAWPDLLDGCLSVPETFEGPGVKRLAYQVCVQGTGMEARLTWTNTSGVGGSAYRMQAWR